jgi:hypothetical protein
VFYLLVLFVGYHLKFSVSAEDKAALAAAQADESGSDIQKKPVDDSVPAVIRPIPTWHPVMS